MNGTEIYIHIPFCARKCNYCDFLSFEADSGTKEKYIEKLKEELVFAARSLGDCEISSVYIGGGTPSVLKQGAVESVMSTLFRHYHVREGAEITIEANPASAMRHKFAEYRASGINRLSLGLQSAIGQELVLLGRLHTFEEFLKAFESARKEGFDNINIDLINHIPLETDISWKKTLKSCLMLKPEHISVYSLIIEPGTLFHNLYEKNLLKLPDEELSSVIDRCTYELMQKHGYNRYEISNFSLPGRECVHNIGYWTGREYLGFGLGASSYFEGYRMKNETELERYLAIDYAHASAEGLSLGKETKHLSREEEMEEFMYLGLRMTAGVGRAEFKRRFGSVMENIFGEALSKYTGNGLMKLSGDRYFLTHRGLDVSNRILCDFLLG